MIFEGGGQARARRPSREMRDRVSTALRNAVQVNAKTGMGIGYSINAYVGVDGVEWRGLEDAVLSEWPRADVTPPQCTEPAGLFAEGDTG